MARTLIELENWLRMAPTVNDQTRLPWFEEGLHWVLSREELGSRDSNILQHRIEQFFHLLLTNPTLAHSALEQIEQSLLQLNWVELFHETALSRRQGFWSSLTDRLLRPLLPEVAEAHDVRPLFHHHFRSSVIEVAARIEKSVWIEWREQWQAIKPLDPKLSEHFSQSAFDALLILSYELASCLSHAGFRAVHKTNSTAESPFHRFQQQVDKITSLLNKDGSEQKALVLVESLELIQACETELKRVLAQLEQTGVSVELVYLISHLEELLKRCETLLILLLDETLDHLQLMLDFVQQLIIDQTTAQSLRAFLIQQLDLVLRKIVERTGETGEHYITRNTKEYWQMLRAGAGGGALTTFTTVLKSVIGHAHFAMFFEGLFTWINYSGSFLLMQACHFSLASKQPAMTGPALASKLKDLRSREQLFDFAREVAHLTRSQFVAALGNVGMTIPCTILFDIIIHTFTGQHVYSYAYSMDTLDALNPFSSLTIPFAAATGVLLWLSSIAAGWVENWTVYRKLPQAIEQNRNFRKVLGVKNAQKLSHWFSHNIAGISSNVAIGFLLAFTPIFGKFFGIGIEVRHVTLSSSALTFALCGSWSRLIEPWPIWSGILAILSIGVLNIGVSFTLALLVALRARHVKLQWVKALGLAVWTQLRLRPLDFFFPPK